MRIGTERLAFIVTEQAVQGHAARITLAGPSHGAASTTPGRMRRAHARRAARLAMAGPGTALRPDWHPAQVIEGELAQNARTWEVLERLGVREGSRLRLSFFYETSGLEADRELARFLNESGYEAAVERDGVSGRTEPMNVGAAALDEWVGTMVHAGYDHGGVRFAGWLATVSRGAVDR